jgi:hypothetical protein
VRGVVKRFGAGGVGVVDRQTAATRLPNYLGIELQHHIGNLGLAECLHDQTPSYAVANHHDMVGNGVHGRFGFVNAARSEQA